MSDGVFAGMHDITLARMVDEFEDGVVDGMVGPI